MWSAQPLPSGGGSTIHGPPRYKKLRNGVDRPYPLRRSKRYISCPARHGKQRNSRSQFRFESKSFMVLQKNPSHWTRRLQSGYSANHIVRVHSGAQGPCGLWKNKRKAGRKTMPETVIWIYSSPHDAGGQLARPGEPGGRD